MITHARLIELLSYNADTGDFVWRFGRTFTAKAGSVAGCVLNGTNGYRYRSVRIDSRDYTAHRLAWFYVHGIWPANQIDHIDGDATNNALSNLRQATHAENMRNRGLLKSNTSGFKGVSWNKNSRKWVAKIRVNGRQKTIGYFRDINHAAAAYQAEADSVHGEFARLK